MATLVINRNSTSVRLESDHLVIGNFEEQKERHLLPLSEVERVIIVGQPSVSFHVLARFMDRGIPCCFLTRGGRWRGMMENDRLCSNAGRKMNQYRRMGDAGLCLSLSRLLIAAKIRNEKRVIQRLCKNRSFPVEKKFPCGSDLSSYQGNAELAQDEDSLRGYEGSAASLYFRMLGSFFPSGFAFTERSRRPPRDSLNALLSFGYTMLTASVTTAVKIHGLDPTAGFMHRDLTGSPSLALDLMEPLRPAIVDLLVADLVTHHRIDARKHFRNGTYGEGVLLNEEGRGIFLEAYENALDRKFEDVALHQKITSRRVIELQVEGFLAVLEGRTESPYFFSLP